MKDSPEKISPLRRRMIEDMHMRKLCTKTQSTYIRAVRHFAGYLGRSPDTAKDETFAVISCIALTAASRRSRSTPRSRDLGFSSR